VLGVTSVSGKVPPVVVAGDKKAKVSLVVAVRNDTASDFNGPVVVSVFASQDAAADTGDDLIVHSDKQMKLKAGQTRNVKLNTPLSSVAAGTYTLLGAVTMDKLTSFVPGASLEVQTPFVHLVSGGPAAPLKKPITPGKKATLTVPLRNDGNVATAKTPGTYTLIFSSDGSEAGAAYQTAATGKIALKPHQFKPQKVSFFVPVGSLAAGLYTVLVKVSADLNDTNGQIVGTLPVAVV
jgi:hypothetical protein